MAGVSHLLATALWVARFAPPKLHHSAAVRLCLKHNDDVGARYHLRQVVECVKTAASTLRELECHNGSGQ